MAFPTWLLLESSDSWLMTRLDGPTEFTTLAAPSAGSAELAGQIVSHCAQSGADHWNLVIALHATSVVAARIPRAEPSRTAEALLYDLEPSLPFDAEFAVADFSDGPDTVLGVALHADRLTSLVQQLEDSGARVISIVPAALAAVQQAAHNRQSGCVLWRSDGAIELVEYTHSTVLRWHHLPDSATAASRELSVEPPSHPIALIEDPALVSDDAAEIGLEALSAVREQLQLPDQVAQFGRRTAAGRVTPWIELRRGPLANGDPHRAWRGAMTVFVAAAGVMLAALAAAFWIRADRYHAQAEAIAQDQQQLFREAFPERRVPRAMLSRLRSEYTRLLNSRQASRIVDLPTSAIEPTYRILQALPDDLRLRVAELRVEDGAFDLAAELTSFREATRLAEALEQHGFAVTPQTQEQLDAGRVSTKFHGEPAAATSMPSTEAEAAP